MSTLSVPLTPELENFINDQVKNGNAANKAHVVRMALQHYEEEQIVLQILKASQEPNLSGDIRKLVKKFKK